VSIDMATSKIGQNDRAGLARFLNAPTPRERKARARVAQSTGRVFGYCRVSTSRQADEGESLGQQERAIAGYAIMNGLTVERVFIERGVSGSKPLADRPQGKALLDTLQAGDAVITAKLDRMFRSAQNALDVLGDLKQRGVSLHMIDLGGDTTGNGISKLVFTILSAAAEAERDRIGERVSDMKADQRQRGRYLGGYVPYGWRVVPDGERGKQLEPIPEQQKAIKLMLRLRDEGLSLRAIQAKLVAEGFPRINHSTIDTALRNAEAEVDRRSAT
jgi:DNA invertase Pin-like site-specific DNA recombinase